MLNLKVEKLTKCATTYNSLKWQWNTYVEAQCSQHSVSLDITQFVQLTFTHKEMPADSIFVAKGLTLDSMVFLTVVGDGGVASLE